MEYLLNLLDSHGLWLGFLLVGVENLGIPLPAELVYIYAQNLINSHRASMFSMMIYFTTAHIAGSVIAYCLGRAGNKFIFERFGNLDKLSQAEDRIKRWHSKYGSATNFLTRFVGYVRPWSSLIAGFGKERLGIFLLWTTLGTVIFNFIALYFAKTILLFWESLPAARYLIGAGFIFFFAGIWLVFPWLHRRFKL